MILYRGPNCSRTDDTIFTRYQINYCSQIFCIDCRQKHLFDVPHGWVHHLIPDFLMEKYQIKKYTNMKSKTKENCISAQIITVLKNIIQEHLQTEQIKHWLNTNTTQFLNLSIRRKFKRLEA